MTRDRRAGRRFPRSGLLACLQPLTKERQWKPATTRTPIPAARTAIEPRVVGGNEGGAGARAAFVAPHGGRRIRLGDDPGVVGIAREVRPHSPRWVMRIAFGADDFASSEREALDDTRATHKEDEMIYAGQTIENPVTGERLHFLKTSRDTNGEAVVVDVTVRPNGFVAAAHVHPSQDERFTITAGQVTFKLDKQEILAKPGDVVLVPAGTAHKFWNAGDEEARFVTEVRPALQFEQLIETMFSLAADGNTNKKGMPNPLRLAVIANAHFDDVRLPFPPALVQRMGLALGAPVGRMLGYRPTYVPAAPKPALVEV